MFGTSNYIPLRDSPNTPTQSSPHTYNDAIDYNEPCIEFIIDILIVPNDHTFSNASLSFAYSDDQSYIQPSSPTILYSPELENSSTCNLTETDYQDYFNNGGAGNGIVDNCPNTNNVEPTERDLGDSLPKFSIQPETADRRIGCANNMNAENREGESDSRSSLSESYEDEEESIEEEDEDDDNSKYGEGPTRAEVRKKEEAAAKDSEDIEEYIKGMVKNLLKPEAITPKMILADEFQFNRAVAQYEQFKNLHIKCKACKIAIRNFKCFADGANDYICLHCANRKYDKVGELNDPFPEKGKIRCKRLAHYKPAWQFIEHTKRKGYKAENLCRYCRNVKRIEYLKKQSKKNARKAIHKP